MAQNSHSVTDAQDDDQQIPALSSVEIESDGKQIYLWFDDDRALRYALNDDGEVEEQSYKDGVVDRKASVVLSPNDGRQSVHTTALTSLETLTQNFETVGDLENEWSLAYDLFAN